MDIVPFIAAAGNTDGQRTEAEANQYFLQLLQENNQVNIFLNDLRIQNALELRAEQRHRFALDNVYAVYAEANAYISHLEATADANHRQQLAFNVSQSTHVLVGQLHNEVRVLESIARAEQRTAHELQAQLTRTQKECQDERSLAMQFDAHRSELEEAEKLQWEENESQIRLTSEEQQYDSLIDDLQDRNAGQNEGEPEHIFRAKRDYEEAASSSTAPPPKQAAIAPKAIASKKMRKVAPKPATVIDDDEAMVVDEATRKGEPADAAGFAPEPEAEAEEEEGDTTDAGGDEPYPLASHPCKECAPIEDLLASDLRGLGDGPKKRGQMSAEAAVIRDAKDRKQRAAKLNYDSVSERFEQDGQFNLRMMQEGRNLEDMQKFDHLSNAVLPDPGRSEEQRYLRAGAHYGGGGIPPAKLVFYAHCEVELFAEVAAVNDAAKRILTFDGEVHVTGTTAEGITAELTQIIADSLRSAQDQNRRTERLAEQNRQAAARNRPSQKGRGRAADPEPMYRGYTQAQWDEYYRQQRRGGYTQAEWDAWDRTHRR
ncbi:kptA [Symbiodinium sp. CCMP2592]|nr:kptA [Symbiodinium sp. CCMP2592]